MHVTSGDGHATVGEIDRQLSENERRLVGLVGSDRVPPGHVHAGDQLADAERLAHVVVGAGLQGLDLVALLSAR